MTREEAINELKQIYDADDYSIPYEIHEALDTAICSLEAWNKVQKEIYKQINALDKISVSRERNAYFKVLDIVNKYLKEVEE